jgi:hypothetical protein
MGRGISDLTRDRLAAVIDYAEENHPVTVRGCAYHLFTRKPPLIDNMGKNCTNEVSRILTVAREEGAIPWDWIVDETRSVERKPSWDDIEDFGRSVLVGYRKDRWVTQPVRVELWSEKGTVRGLLAPILDAYQIPFRVMHGYGSATSVNDIAELIEEVVDGGQDFVALYVGDWDPSGLDMSERDLPNRVERYGDGAEFTLRRIALVKSDLDSLPSFPLETKRKDPRHDWYRRNYHSHLCWELDAMNPVTLRNRVEEAILEYIDAEAWNRANEVEAAEIANIREIAKQFSTVLRRSD